MESEIVNHSDPSVEDEMLLELSNQDHILANTNRNDKLRSDIDGTISHAKACGLFPCIHSVGLQHTVETPQFVSDSAILVPALLVNDTKVEDDWCAAYQNQKKDFRESLKVIEDIVCEKKKISFLCNLNLMHM